MLDGLHDGESVNRSQIDIKLKTCDIRTWKKTFISQHILRQHCPIALPVRQKPKHRGLLTCLSHFRNSVSTSSSSAKPLQQDGF
jgi:hypothetical protein